MFCVPRIHLRNLCNVYNLLSFPAPSRPAPPRPAPARPGPPRPSPARCTKRRAVRRSIAQPGQLRGTGARRVSLNTNISFGPASDFKSGTYVIFNAVHPPRAAAPDTNNAEATRTQGTQCRGWGEMPQLSLWEGRGNDNIRHRKLRGTILPVCPVCYRYGGGSLAA